MYHSVHKTHVSKQGLGRGLLPIYIYNRRMDIDLIEGTMSVCVTVCPRSLDSFDIVSYYIKWAYLTYSIVTLWPWKIIKKFYQIMPIYVFHIGKKKDFLCFY